MEIPLKQESVLFDQTLDEWVGAYDIEGKQEAQVKLILKTPSFAYEPELTNLRVMVI
jgi:hypothetical protein